VPLHPRTVAERLGARYVVAPHNSQLVEELLSEAKPDLGVIAGARILKGYVISKFRIGIVNLHPGLLPEVRGLDAMLWSIYKDVPLGVTAHLIDESVDAGRLLLREEIPIFADDTLLDHQLKLLAPALEAAMRGDWTPFERGTLPRPNRKMPPELERQVVGKLEEYKKRFALVEGKMP
jgi:phosphoribosylglycinamide formyltransferase-1